LEDLHKKDILSQNALRETQDAFEFLLRLRNDLHYREGKEADILTLRRQGPIADFFGYPQNNLLQRIEELMRDYYTCARDLRQHTETLFEEAELNRSASKRLFFQTSVSVKPDRQFDDFHARDKRLFGNDPEVFTRKPQNLLHLFYLCQKFDLSPYTHRQRFSLRKRAT